MYPPQKKKKEDKKGKSRVQRFTEKEKELFLLPHKIIWFYFGLLWFAGVITPRNWAAEFVRKTYGQNREGINCDENNTH